MLILETVVHAPVCTRFLDVSRFRVEYKVYSGGKSRGGYLQRAFIYVGRTQPPYFSRSLFILHAAARGEVFACA